MKDIVYENLEGYKIFSKYFIEMAIQRNHFKTQAEIIDKFTNTLSDNSMILDIACGSGYTFSDLKNASNFQLHGIDGSTEMLELAKQKEDLKQVQFRKLQWDQLGQIFQETGKFHLIYNLGNSISHIESLTELELLFINIYEGLNDRGIFLFDFREWDYNPETKSLYQEGRKVRKEYFTKFKGEDMSIIEKCEYLDGRQYISYTFKNNNSSERFRISYLMFEKDRIIEMLTKIGFSNIKEIESTYLTLSAIKLL